jgi:predicted TIM-barrel fold metal-dependent hydrolase
MIPATARGPIDMHVHLVGNGRAGSGNWMNLAWHRRLMGEFMLHSIGLKADLTDNNFDDVYADFVAQLVQESSLSHAVVLAHEEVYAEDGRKLKFGSFHVSNDWALTIGKRHPNLLPAVSIHPARADALKELERCVQAGAVMVKILPPSQNIDCSRPPYREFFKLMAQAQIPLLSHTGGEYTVPVYRKKLFSPQLLRQPLDCGVTVIAAHAATRSAPAWWEADEMPDFLAMLKEYPHCYGDNSALNSPNRSHGLKTCLTPAVMAQLVHGSDFPVPISGMWAKLRGLIEADTATQAKATKNLLERDYFLKKEMGFTPSVFTRVWDLLRLD